MRKSSSITAHIINHQTRPPETAPRRNQRRIETRVPRLKISSWARALAASAA